MSSIPQPDIPRRPKRSSFQNVGEVRPTPADPTAPADPASAPASAPEPVAASAKKRPVHTVDILLSLPEELKTRMVNTIAWTTPRTGIRHQQAFIRKGIEDLCAQLERDHNNGHPFDPIAGE